MSKEKEEVVNGTTYKYSSEWIHDLESENHWRLYWTQQKLMEGEVRRGDEVLEIGVGSGFAANYLESQGVSVTTLDIDADKNPDIVANLVEYDFQKKYDHILAFEVFEHLPFEELEEIASRIKISCRQGIFMSVPLCQREIIRLEYRVPFFGSGVLNLPLKKREVTEPHHFWEIGCNGVKERDFYKIFTEKRFEIQETMEKFSRLFISFKMGN